MSRDEALNILVEFQGWRRGDNIPQPDPKVIGEALDEAIGILSEKGDRPPYYHLVHITYHTDDNHYLQKDYAWLAVNDYGHYIWTLSDNTTVIDDEYVIMWDYIQEVTWTSVDYRLPNTTRKVLAKTDNDNIFMGRYQLTHPNKWYVYGFGQSQMPKVTHWREIIE